MNYRELFQFEAVEHRVRLRDADQLEGAGRLASSFAISREMAARLTDQVFPGLSFDAGRKGRALLVAGGRGTGKSHLLAVISGVCEQAALARTLLLPEAAKRNESTGGGQAGVEAIAGRFKVIRVEIGSAHLPLRDVLLLPLEQYLAAEGVDYSFPAGSKSHLDRKAFGEMLAAFQRKFPEHGLLLVVDELADYLASRKKRDLFLDLHFLGEIAEACQGTRFRFLGGIRENLWDSPRLSVAGEILQAIKDRFDLLPITARDLQQAVAERLARKSPEQKAKVEAHLQRFAGRQGAMAERWEEFVAAFPIHPDVVEIFTRIPQAGRMEVLRELSAMVKQRLDQPLPPNEPGLIACDSLWQSVRAHPELKATPEIEAVEERCKALAKKARSVFADPGERSLAVRLVQALGALRLATDDIYSRHGTTPAELRDLLCPFAQSSEGADETPPDRALTRISAILQRLREASGDQNLTFESDRGQYGLSFQRFRRFVRPELILHWVNAVPFVLLMITAGIMVAYRFWHFERQLFDLTVLIHKIFAVIWITALPLVVLAQPKAHWAHIREMLKWGKGDLVWMIQSLRALYNRKAILAAVGRFNTGQKINACLVMVYFLGFGTTGLLMLFRGSILFPWYVHAALFFATLGSVGGHLFLSLINPSTRIALAGIFNGWSPMEYVEHHHALSLPSSHRTHAAPVTLTDIIEEVFVSKVELVALAAALIMAVVGLFVFSHGQLASARNKFAKGFADLISPNQLSLKHRIGPPAESCIQCHSYTGVIPDEKCTACHRIVAARRAAQVGYHGRLKGDCVSCHKEHSDAPRTIVPLDPAKFSHDLAIFKLMDKHAKVECDQCHKQKRGPEAEKGYYLGVKHDLCDDCHRDPHRSQFVAACEKCHSARGWQGAELKFAHDKDSDYPLDGKHKTVDCLKCHKAEAPGGSLGTATFKGLGRDCIACHEDPHRKQFAAACTGCHSTEGWGRKALAFDHNKDTKFSLSDKHAEIRCEKCHKPSAPSDKLAYATFRGLKSGCADCHKDPHRGQFETACTKCHSPAGWKTRALAFDHNKDSQYPLLAKHAEVACNKCHIPSRPGEKLGYAQFRGLKTECAACHKDPHDGQFEPGCVKCHPGPVAWTGQQLAFTHNEDSQYLLEGKHTTVDCVKCHRPRSPSATLASAQFKGLGTACEACHQVKHPESYGPLCLSCHSVKLSWPKEKPGIDHIRKYDCCGETLSGAHLHAECRACHSATRVSVLGQGDKVALKCQICHATDDAHQGALGPDCAKCHNSVGWKGENLKFNHNTMTSYVLDKDHRNVACAKCHMNNQWKPLKSTCKDCHPNKY